MSDRNDAREHNEHIKTLYENHLADNPTEAPEASHWIDENRVDLRFDVLTDIGDLQGTRVLDFGCGNGLFYDYLRKSDVECEYVGWDISPEMVEIARDRHPEGTFRVVDVLKEDLSTSRNAFNYVIASGVFHISGDRDDEHHRDWYRSVMEQLWPLTSDGLAVNFFSEFVDYEEENLYYCSLEELVPFCVDRFSRWYALRHDYELYEFTIYLYDSPNSRP